MDTRQYSNPLLERYASDAMSHVFSPDFKFTTWRKLWITLAECEKELGVPVTQEQLDEMKRHVSDIDYAMARAFERKTRHDVMAHVLTFGEACPLAKPIIHLGATSADIGDNTDLIQLREASLIIIRRLTAIIRTLRNFAFANRSLATLGFTHFQPAQLTTVGKRASLWLWEFCMDFESLEQFLATLPFRGVKGATGTQASFMTLFDDNQEKIRRLDRMVAERWGFSRVIPVTGQTYSRKIDAQVIGILSGIAQSMHKFANDIRLLQHMKEIEEPFAADQIGSSAMAYKRNPMRAERLTSLARYVISLSSSPAMTAAEQWFERTLDDSANKRLSIPEAFLACDASCVIAADIIDGLVIYPKVIEKHIAEELPFMATETILMEAVRNGGDRQALHERIRRHSMDAGYQVKNEGRPNDLLDRIAADPAFGMSRAGINALMDVARFVGRAPEQVSEYIETVVDPLLQRAQAFGAIARGEVTV